MEWLQRTASRGWRGAGNLCALLAFVVLASALWPIPSHAADVRTVLDVKGQIIAIVDADGSVAMYSWDLAGNLTGITRISPGVGPIAVTLVSPNQGLPNDAISIYGKGLANPTSVTFNGAAATVLESSANHIATRVPASATTGLIRVQVGRDGANSPSAFTVLSSTPLTISPTAVSLLPGGTQQFTASGPGTWSVNLAPGGTSQVGTISPGGLYTAPPAGGPTWEVTVAATSPGNPQDRAEASVLVLGTPAVRAPFVSVAPKADPLPSPLVAAQREPVITAVNPASLARGSTNVTVTLTGRGLVTPTALQFLRGLTNDTLISYANLTALPDGTQATFTISIAATAVIGDRVLRITVRGVNSTREGTVGNMLQVTGP